MLLAKFLLSFLLFYVSSCKAGDPCPKATVLSPCTCLQQVVGQEAPEEAHPGKKLVPMRRRRSDDISLLTPEFPMDNNLVPKDKNLVSKDNNLVSDDSNLVSDDNNLLSDDSNLYTVVKCKEPKSQDILEDRISSGLNRRWVDKLIMDSIPPEKRSILAQIPGDCLKNVRIRKLEIRNTVLYGDFTWKEYPLKDQAESLYWLTVYNCSLSGALTYDTIGTVHTKGLNELRRLQVLDLSSNHLRFVMHTAFKAPQPNLTTLVLSRNNIQNIEHNSFVHIHMLKHIDLSHNQLTSLHRNFFEGTPKNLQHIDLSWNSLRLLPHDFFNNMPALRYVDISHNFLHSIPDRPWNQNQIWKQLTYIDISGNFVECDCDLLWLLPILLTTNSTSPSALPGQTVVGKCAQPMRHQNLQTLNHNFTSLTRAQLNC